MIRVFSAALVLAALVSCDEAAPDPSGAGGAGGEANTGGEGGESICAPCVDEGDEDCVNCWNDILRCCYTAEERALASPRQMGNACADDDACRVCCNECAALDCDTMKARGMCPNLF